MINHGASPAPAIRRRDFLCGTLAATAATVLPGRAAAAETPSLSLPDSAPIDFHVHLDKSTIDAVLPLSRERGVKFGIVEHAGTRENVYPVVLSNDAELRAYIAMLGDRPVYKGVQAEYDDWFGCFSREALAQLDFILTDAMTMPGPDGKREKLWEKGAHIGEPQAFMDRYVDWHVHLLQTCPIDIFANITWLPQDLLPNYDALWTPARMRKVIDAAVTHGAAIEISAKLQLPRMPFLEMAKASGAKFTFGSNGRYPDMGKIEYSLATAKQLGLAASDMFRPVPGNKAIRRWNG
ncbi:MAG TPA: hypothetical protein PLU30_09280 [Verrucomicrobiae bacterium]|nr:hypothetical protein [Verrucomicrobiae bacterium]